MKTMTALALVLASASAAYVCPPTNESLIDPDRQQEHRAAVDSSEREGANDQGI